MDTLVKGRRYSMPNAKTNSAVLCFSLFLCLFASLFVPPCCFLRGPCRAPELAKHLPSLSSTPCFVPPNLLKMNIRFLFALVVCFFATSAYGARSRPPARGNDDEFSQGGRAPPDVRAIDLALDEARLDDNDAVVDALKNIKMSHMKEMGEMMNEDEFKAAMKKIDSLSAKLEGSSGKERQDLHQQLHEAIGTLEDGKFIAMGLNEEDQDLHRALLREKHAIVIQLVDDDELQELSSSERQALMDRFEDVEIKMVSHMKDYFLNKAKSEL